MDAADRYAETACWIANSCSSVSEASSKLVLCPLGDAFILVEMRSAEANSRLTSASIGNGSVTHSHSPG